MLHTEIRDQLLSLINAAGENMIGYGFMRVLETLIDLAEHEGKDNALISAVLPALNTAMDTAARAGSFEVINFHDTRSDAQVCADMRMRGIPIDC